MKRIRRENIFKSGTGLFWIPKAASAYCSVDNVSSVLITEGDSVAMIDVLHFPPRDSCNVIFKNSNPPPRRESKTDQRKRSGKTI